MTKRQDFPANEYPFSDQLCNFMDAHADFFDSLKLANYTRFKLIPIIAITHTPDTHLRSGDEIIGMFYCDVDNYHENRPPFFKQDYVVNIDGMNQKFVSYSASQSSGAYVKPMADFFTMYGNNGQFYHRNGTRPWEHHYDNARDLPDYLGLRQAGQDLLNTL
jgi:hypothetical protein